MFSINIQNHLQSKNIEWVLNNLLWLFSIIKLIKEKWVDLGFTTNQLKIKLANLVKEREKYKEQLAYAAGFINQNISNIYKPFILNTRQALKKWKALKERFKDLNLAAVTNIIATFFTKHV